VTRLADRVVVIAEGRVIAEGPPAEALSRADMGALTGRFDEGSVIEARVATHDAGFELTTLAFAGGELIVPNLDALPGEPVRVRVRARDVSLALARPSGITIQNVLEGNVVSIGHEFGAIVDVAVRIGDTGLTARITRKAVSDLALVPGSRVFAMVKAVSIDRRSVGFA
jgi:molybdate transport system ATP-binding protein